MLKLVMIVAALVALTVTAEAQSRISTRPYAKFGYLTDEQRCANGWETRSGMPCANKGKVKPKRRVRVF